MRFQDTLSLSTRMFKTRTMRTLLTILGVGIGIGAVLFLVSLGYGLQNVILDEITTGDALLSLDVTPGSSDLISLDQDTVDRIGSMENVAETARMKNFSAQIALGDLVSDSAVRVIDPAYFRLNGLSADHGSLFEQSNAGSMVVSSATAKLFDKMSDDLLGQEISLTLFVPTTNEDGFEDVEVVAIDRTFTVSGVFEDDTVSYAFVPFDTIPVTHLPSFDGIKVKVASEEVAPGIRDQIINEGFVVSALSDIIEQANKIFGVVQIILGLFGLIALVVSAIGMFNTMTIALLERINEIGIMQSIGVARSDIRKLFLIESMLMGFLGGIGGVLLGYLAGELANLGVNLLANTLGGTALDLFDQPMWFIAVIIFFSTFIGFLTGVFPSRRAANMDPLEALRYK